MLRVVVNIHLLLVSFEKKKYGKKKDKESEKLLQDCVPEIYGLLNAYLVVLLD